MKRPNERAHWPPPTPPIATTPKSPSCFATSSEVSSTGPPTKLPGDEPLEIRGGDAVWVDCDSSVGAEPKKVDLRAPAPAASIATRMAHLDEALALHLALKSLRRTPPAERTAGRVERWRPAEPAVGRAE